MKLLIAIGLLAAAASAQPVNTTGKNLGDLIKDIQHIEDDLMKTVFTDIKADLSEAAKNKQSLEEAAIHELEQKASEFKQKVVNAMSKFDAAKQEAEAKIEQQREKMIEEFRQKVEEKKAAKKAEMAEAKAQYDKMAAAVKEKLAAKKAEKEQKRAEMKAKLDELAETVKENRAAREAEKEQRKADEKAERDAFIDSFKSQLASLGEERKMLEGNYEAFKQKEAELEQQLKDALGQSMKARYAECVEAYLQENLEKEYVKRGVDAIMYPAKEAEQKHTMVGPGPVVQAAPKASLIDQLTGKSSWETVAWVLLALCIVLAVALIALIIFQVRNNNKSGNSGPYERLDGHNEGGAPPHLGSEKQGLLAAAQPKQSVGGRTGGPGPSDINQKASISSPSAPVVEEPREEQQF